MSKKIKPQRGQTVVYVHQQPKGYGCLVTAVIFLLFGWLGIGLVACWKLTKTSARWTVTVGLKWPLRAARVSWIGFVALCVWSWKSGRSGTAWTVARVRALVAARRNRAA